MSRVPTRVRLVAALLSTMALAGCGHLSDLSMSPKVQAHKPTPSAAASDAPRLVAATRKATPERTPVPVPTGALAAGSATHKVQAGARSVVLDYWSTLPATKWTVTSDPVLQIAAHVEGGGNENKVKITHFGATYSDGRTTTQVGSDDGEFAFTPPFSYTTALPLPRPASGTRSATVLIQLNLLVETAPDSHEYFRNTVLDRVRLGYLPGKAS
jgi:hypothetical protein